MPHPVAHALPDDPRLEFRERGDHLDEEPAERPSGVDRLVDGGKVDPAVLHLPLRGEEVVQVPAQPIELGNYDRTDPRRAAVDDQPFPDRSRQISESGAVCRSPGEPVVDELTGEVVSLRRAVRPDARPLRLDREPLARLVLRAHPVVRDSWNPLVRLVGEAAGGARRSPFGSPNDGMGHRNDNAGDEDGPLPQGKSHIRRWNLTRVRGEGTGLRRSRPNEAHAFVREYLASHPGSTGPEIVAEGTQRKIPRSSIYRALRPTHNKAVSRARGRYWLGQIDDSELAVEAEVERTLAFLRSPAFPEDAKREVARQLSREATRAPPRSRHVAELIALPDVSLEVRRALLPFVFIATRAAFERRSENGASDGGTAPVRRHDARHRGEPDARDTRRFWEAARRFLEPFIADSGEDGTLAWNAVYEAVASPGVLGNEECLGLAKRAIDVESRWGLPPPSAARSVLRRLGHEDRLREPIRLELLRRLSAEEAEPMERVRTMLRELDLGPFNRTG